MDKILWKHKRYRKKHAMTYNSEIYLRTHLQKQGKQDKQFGLPQTKKLK